MVEMPSLAAAIKALVLGVSVSRDMSEDAICNDRFCEVRIDVEKRLYSDAISTQTILAAESLLTISVCGVRELGQPECPRVSGGPWSDACVMDTTMKNYVDVVERTVLQFALHLNRKDIIQDQAELAACTERMKVVVSSLARLGAIQPFLFLHWLPSCLQSGHMTSLSPEEWHPTERRLLGVIADTCSLLCRFPNCLDPPLSSSTSSGDSDASEQATIRGPSSKQHGNDTALFRMGSAGEMTDTLRLQQLSPGCRELEMIYDLVRAQRWLDLMALVLARTTIVVSMTCKTDNNRLGPLGSLVQVVQTAMDSKTDASTGHIVMTAFACQSLVLLPMATVAPKSAVASSVSPLSLVARGNQTIHLLKDIVSTLVGRGRYMSLFDRDIPRSITCPPETSPFLNGAVTRAANCLSSLVGKYHS